MSKIEILIDDRMKVQVRTGEQIRFTVSWGLQMEGEEYVQTTRGCLAGWSSNGKYWLLPTLRSGPKNFIKPCTVSPALYNKVLEELDSMGVFENMSPDPSFFKKLPVEKTEVTKEKEFLKLPSPYEARQKKLRCG